MIEKISSVLAEKLLQNTNDSDQDNYEILKYGIECIINTFLPVIFFVIYSFFQKIFIEMLCWFTIFIAMRNAIGGYHASSHERCILLSTVYGLFSLMSLQHMWQLTLNTKIIIITIVLIIHILFTPIISQEDKKTTEDIKFLKRKAIIILLIASLLSIIFHRYALPISNAILLGVINAELLFLIGKFHKKRHLLFDCN